MAEIIPFISTRFNPRMISDLADVVTPPYDVISSEQQEAYYNQHDNNVIRLILGKKHPNDDEFKNQYSRAANDFNDWKSKGIMLEDEKAAYYIYEQEYSLPGEKVRRKRRGFLGLLRLEQLQKGKVLGHEQTFAGPKADRLKLLRAAQTNFSPIFTIYQDKEKKTDKLLAKEAEGPPVAEFTTADNITHRLWIMSDSNQMQKLRALMADRELMIADGHHRYETAIQFKEEMHTALPNSSGPHAFDYTLVYCNNSEDEGMQILPYNRVLCSELDEGVEREEIREDLEEYYNLKSFKVDVSNVKSVEQQVSTELTACSKKAPGLVMLFPDGEAFALSLKDKADINEMIDQDLPEVIKKMPVSLIQHHIIPHIWIGNPEIELEEGDVNFVNTVGQVLQKFKKRQGCVAFILNSVKIEEVFNVAALGHRMPQKSTYFYPKLITGLIIRELRLRC